MLCLPLMQPTYCIQLSHFESNSPKFNFCECACLTFWLGSDPEQLTVDTVFREIASMTVYFPVSGCCFFDPCTPRPLKPSPSVWLVQGNLSDCCLYRQPDTYSGGCIGKMWFHAVTVHCLLNSRTSNTLFFLRKRNSRFTVSLPAPDAPSDWAAELASPCKIKIKHVSVSSG